MMASISKQIIAVMSVVLLAAVFVVCSKKESKDGILAIVGDRVITRDEFIRRAEYTIRPPYCKQNSDMDKTIILNSIIAEELVALEAGVDNPLARRPSFQAYIRGRKEQMMRQTLFKEIVRKKIRPDTSELNKRYRMARREYRVAYCSIDRDIARFVLEKKSKSSPEDLFDAVYRKAGGLGAPAERVVSWKSQEIRAVHRALFSEPLVKDQVIGPIQVDADQFLMLKVLSWIYRPVVTDTEIKRITDEVYEDWEREKAESVWDDYVIGLMKNKRLDFNRDTFEKMARLFQPLYMRTHQKTMPFMDQDDARDAQQSVIDSVGIELKKQNFEGRSFFMFEGKTWTVADFMAIYASHPLVFRKSRFSTDEFPEQFKFAVADLMRDQIINQEAYDKGIDKLPSVQAYTSMWQDALIAKYWQFAYLQTKTTDRLSDANLGRILDDYLNPYTDSLFSRYSESIRINIPVLEDIKLTRIDMVALNENVPYPETVPPFPILTSESRLNYGRRLE
ncbi:hypothetical protein JW835_05700 [bacterium]|nr:hypothetical protein [bacterium]